jgi:arsenate reductase
MWFGDHMLLMGLKTKFAQQIVCEFVGSLFLAAIVVGSGIAAQTLSPHDIGLELLENSLATAAGLYVLISVCSPISGAHFNPLVTATNVLRRSMSIQKGSAYFVAQFAGCFAGTGIANIMFTRAVLSISTHHRMTTGHFVGEIVATTGLIFIILVLVQSDRTALVPGVVASYIGAAYFFTSSTSFANPAITFGRMFSNSFSGIAPSSVPGFLGAQCLGALFALLLATFLTPMLSHTREVSL